jgi:type IX secretion system PorP/SprF family membrane protein
MKQIRLIILIVIAICAQVEFSHGQQDAQYTQYMYNTLSINPAYAGSRDALSILSLYRNHWVGIQGAPTTFALSAHTPLRNEKIGIGVSIVKDDIWIQDETSIDFDFSYTIESFRGYSLAFGIRGGAKLENIRFSQIQQIQNASDLPEDTLNRFLPNFGFGLYYYNDDFYVGYSIPSLLKRQYFDGNPNLVEDRITHYIMAGYVLPLNRSVLFKPAVLIKTVAGSPIQTDLSANFLINDVVSLGLGYRMGSALSAVAGFNLSENLLVGYSYDWETTELNKYNSGSHELFLRWEFELNFRCKCYRFF